MLTDELSHIPVTKENSQHTRTTHNTAYLQRKRCPIRMQKVILRYKLYSGIFSLSEFVDLFRQQTS